MQNNPGYPPMLVLTPTDEWIEEFKNMQGGSPFLFESYVHLSLLSHSNTESFSFEEKRILGKNLASNLPEKVTLVVDTCGVFAQANGSYNFACNFVSKQGAGSVPNSLAGTDYLLAEDLLEEPFVRDLDFVPHMVLAVGLNRSKIKRNFMQAFTQMIHHKAVTFDLVEILPMDTQEINSVVLDIKPETKFSLV